MVEHGQEQQPRPPRRRHGLQAPFDKHQVRRPATRRLGMNTSQRVARGARGHGDGHDGYAVAAKGVLSPS
eukprot:365329-Chlamydomonas_euryale.AAC.3